MAASCVPKCLLRLARAAVPERVEGLIFGNSARRRVCAGHGLDRVNLHTDRVSDIRRDAILEALLGQSDRLGSLLEEIDNRRAAESEHLDVDGFLDVGTVAFRKNTTSTFLFIFA